MKHRFAGTRSEAVFSADEKNRYWLCREWGVMEPFGVFLLINPSCADAIRLDYTTSDCTNLALGWGWRGFGIVNLFADINSKHSNRSPDPENDDWIRRGRKRADVFILGTGEGEKTLTDATLKKLRIKKPYHVISLNELDDSYRHPRGAKPTAPPQILL